MLPLLASWPHYQLISMKNGCLLCDNVITKYIQYKIYDYNGCTCWKIEYTKSVGHIYWSPDDKFTTKGVQVLFFTLLFSISGTLDIKNTKISVLSITAVQWPTKFRSVGQITDHRHFPKYCFYCYSGTIRDIDLFLGTF